MLRTRCSSGADNGGADGVYTSTNVKFVDDPEYADDAGVQTFLEAMATYAPDTNAPT